MASITKQLRTLAPVVLMLLGLGFSTLATSGPAQAADGSRFFPETGHTLSGKFLDYWNNNGGLAAFGYPITEPANELDSETGQVYLTQWFERNNFQLHPEFVGTRYEVELGLLAKRLTHNRQDNDPAFQPGSARAGYFFFPQTRHNVSDLFYRYWQNNGSLDRLGLPIAEEQPETEPATGKVYLTQWFERARFEYHPEKRPPYTVELGLLGNEIKYASPVGILNLFYQSINNRTYRQAYNYWDTPPRTLSPYNQWVQGYADTAAVQFTAGNYRIDVGAGNAYAGVPAVLISTNKNGTKQAFYGCYITHRINIEPDQPWFISRGIIQQDNTRAELKVLLDKAVNSCPIS